MVKQYDVYRIGPHARGSVYTHVIVLQSQPIAVLKTAIVAPIGKVVPAHRLSRLHIPIEIEGQASCIVMPELGAYAVSQLRDLVCTAEHLHDSVMSAIDLLFAGI